MDKHEKAQLVKAITHLQREGHDEALEILYGLVGLVYPGPRPPDLAQHDQGSPGDEADRLIDRRRWEEVLNV